MRRLSLATSRAQKRIELGLHCVVCGVVIGWALASPAQETEKGRPMAPSDLLSIRGYGAQSPSPDGRFIAVEVMRSRQEDSSNVALDFVTRSNLWIVRRDGRGRQLLLKDRPSVTRSWQPQWSPKGRYLAFLAGRDNAFAYVWDRAGGHATRIDTGPIDLASELSKGPASSGSPLCWLDDSHLLLIALPDTERALWFLEDKQGLAIEQEGLNAANRGRTPSVIVASSPPDSESLARLTSHAHLLVVDVRHSTVRQIGEVPEVRTRAAMRLVVVSRTGRFAAIVAHLNPGAPDSLVGWDVPTAYPARLGVVALSGRREGVRWLPGVIPYTGTTFTDDLPLTWRSNDSSFVVMTIPKSTAASRRRGAGRTLALTAVDPRALTWRTLVTFNSRPSEAAPSIEPDALEWTDDGRLKVRSRSSPTFWTADGDSLTPMAADPGDARPTVAASPALTLNVSSDGELFTIDSSGMHRTLFPAVNPQISAIEPPHYVSLRYTDTRGDTLNATALLPYHYVPTHRYPTVVYVYGGDVPSANDSFAERTNPSFLNMLLLSAHGYVVLKPSIPLEPEGVPSDPMLRLNDGVEPAIDSLIRLGIVDSTRLALLGHSYGGYTVYGLVTQTNRYKAAIALAGISDLVSLYGGFDPRHRYTDPNEAATVGPEVSEFFQMRMGVPPWRDPERYIRNSPVFHADNVRTPLLIVQGDLDNYNTQNEEFFTALYRLGRRAEFVRYGGEAHVFESPADIVDLWQRMFSWLDEYLMTAPR
jgi:acetyl esterase/lipase